MIINPVTKRPEPTIQDLLEDPIAHLIMNYNGITAADVNKVMERTKIALLYTECEYEPTANAA